MTEEKDEGGFEDFMEGIGLSHKPLTAEDDLLIRMNGGSGNDLHVYRYWLLTELHHYYHLVQQGALLMRFSQIKQEYVPFTKEEYVISMTKYYLQMQYHGWLNRKVSALGNVDPDKMAKLLMNQEVIQKLINTPQPELPVVRG